MSKTLAQDGTLVWFRNDLRIEDNLALQAAMQRQRSVIALYIHETDSCLRPVTGATRWWLHRSLNSLASNLARYGIELQVADGQAAETIEATVARFGISTVFWNRRYGQAERALDAAIKTGLRERGVAVKSLNATLLVEPWDIATKEGKPFSVFTPFWNAMRQCHIPAPVATQVIERKAGQGEAVDTDYDEPGWSRKLDQHWAIGEVAARDKLAAFLDQIEGYEWRRDQPDDDATSRLSPHLRFGEIGPRAVWHAAMACAHRHPGRSGAIDKFLSELAWRDFNYHQLYHRENIAEVPMQARFADMPWRKDEQGFERWTTGATGFPIVDAGMRELWETGYMHNRVRMLTASLLTKNLLIDWHKGERWFWDCLVDADAASNPGNWQWVAGCGLDASPWFRIFNPQVQGERFDPRGAYVRRWVPEITALPDEWIHRPYAAPADVLKKAGVVIGKTYPAPIVDLKATRQRALDMLPKK